MKSFSTAVLVAGLLVAVTLGKPQLGGVLQVLPTNSIFPIAPVLGGVDPTTLGLLNAGSQLLSYAPTTVQANVKNFVALLKTVTVKGATPDQVFDAIYEYVLIGFYLATSTNSNTTNSQGGLGLPTATLCQLGLQYQYTSCYICNEDCYVAHNLWGGDCGASPQTGNQTCLCANSASEAAARNLTTDSAAACQVPNPIASFQSYIIAVIFRIRYELQCLSNSDGTFDSTGCNVDCTQNHGAKSGLCQWQKPNVPLNPSPYVYGSTAVQPFCICSFTDSPNIQYQQPTPANITSPPAGFPFALPTNF